MPRVLLPVLPAVLAAVLVAGGCGDAAGPEPRAERERESPRATPSVTAGPVDPADPSAAPSRSTPTATSSLTAAPSKGVGKIAPTPLPMARPDGSRTHLLTAETLPAAGGWTVRSTAPEGSRRVGACQEASLVDIGALHALIRVFDGPDGSGLRSRQLVARLADPKSAWRTHEVLRSWEADCEERPAHPERRGIVREGRWLSVVEITATEGDVPRGWTRRAVRRIAATFG